MRDLARALTWAIDFPRAAQNDSEQLCGFAAQFLQLFFTNQAEAACISDLTFSSSSPSVFLLWLQADLVKAVEILTQISLAAV